MDPEDSAGAVIGATTNALNAQPMIQRSQAKAAQKAQQGGGQKKPGLLNETQFGGAAEGGEAAGAGGELAEVAMLA
jgi:hypothetical protein